MIIWSLQPKKVVKIIESGKTFRCDGRRASHLRMDRNGWNDNFLKAYRWIVQQMKSRGIQDDDKYPVWGWYRFHSAGKGRKAPRLHQIHKKDFRIKLSIPDEIVLLSNYYAWHEPLNDMFCGSNKFVMKMMTIEDNKTWSAEKLEHCKIKSWQNIFKFEDDDAVQACFSSIKPEYVLKIEKSKCL